MKIVCGSNRRWQGRAVAAAFAFILGVAFSVQAQEATANQARLETSATYSFVRANGDNSNGGFNLNGASSSFVYRFTGRFSMIADVGAYRFSSLPSGLNSTMYTYLFGPRIALRKSGRSRPFAHLLLGGGRLTASSSGIDAAENGFAMATGGGLDIGLGSHIAVRAIQAEYLLTRFPSVSGASATQNNVRISAGLVFRFGAR